ncbi:MAG: glycosyltransferase [Bacteroidota bacterium]
METKNPHKPDLLIVGFPSWKDDYVKSTLVLSTELARYYRVLYVEYAYTWKDVFSGLRGKVDRPVNRILGLENRIRSIETYHGGEVEVLTLPPVLPINWIDNESVYIGLNRANGRRAGKAIQKAMHKLGMNNPVMINAFQPFLGINLEEYIPHSLSIYYCYDEIGHAKWAGKYGKVLENALLPKVDVLVCSSTSLLNQRRTLQVRATTVKNGVYFEQFASQVKAANSSPTQKLKVGYWGSIDDRTDFDLIQRCLDAYPEVEFLLIGKIDERVKDEKVLQNERIHLPGPLPPDELPKWSQQMIMGIIPFVNNGFTAGIYPMKINEYLACGLPVLTTDFGDIQDFNSIAHIATDKEGFVHKMGMILSSDECIDRNELMEFARQNSWRSRGEAFAQLIDKEYQRKYGQELLPSGIDWIQQIKEVMA